MTLLSLLLQVAAATMLLLFAVKTVQKGIQANAGIALRRGFSGPTNRMKSAAVGTLSAMLLQSSAAVALLTASFVSMGAVNFSAALSTVLGADFGSALIVLALSFQLDWLLPTCLAVGGWLYLKSNGRQSRKIGQALLGVGLILLSLQLLSEAFEPIRSSSHWPSVVAYMEGDLLTAFLLGAALAFVIHSSVATILMCVALAEVGAITLPIGLALTLGANLGSSLIPVWLTRDNAMASRRVIISNFVLRGTAATLAFLTLDWLWLFISVQFESAGQTLIATHVAFNALLLLTLPFIGRLEPLLLVFMPDPTIAEDPIAQWHLESCLVPSVGQTPGLALANIRREIMRMSQLVNTMARPALTLYQHPSSTEHTRVRQNNKTLNSALATIRQYSANLPYEDMSKQERYELRELLDTAIDLVAAGGIITTKLGVFAEKVQAQHIHFSDDGWNELAELNRKVMENMTLAFGALAADDTTLARTVVEAENGIHDFQRRSRKHHFERLRNGEGDSFDSSDIHLETLYAFKELNTKITEIVYPILSRNGHLLDNRLVMNTQS